jgi:hypothetical protein
MLLVTCAECGCLTRDLEFCDNCKARRKNGTASTRCVIPRLPPKPDISNATTQELPGLTAEGITADTAELSGLDLPASPPAESKPAPVGSPAPVPVASAAQPSVATFPQEASQTSTSTLLPAPRGSGLSWVMVLAVGLPLLVVGVLLWLAIQTGILDSWLR